MADFEVQLQNKERILDAFRRFPRTAEFWMQRAIVAGAAELHKAATRETVPWRTGRLVQSFGQGITIGRLYASVRPTVKYAIFVHEGTQPHLITVVNKRVLADKKTGRFFGTKVHHPGTRPRRFLIDIIEKASPAIQQHFEQALDKIAQATASTP